MVMMLVLELLMVCVMFCIEVELVVICMCLFFVFFSVRMGGLIGYLVEVVEMMVWFFVMWLMMMLVERGVVFVCVVIVMVGEDEEVVNCVSLLCDVVFLVVVVRFWIDVFSVCSCEMMLFLLFIFVLSSDWGMVCMFISVLMIFVVFRLEMRLLRESDMGVFLVWGWMGFG